MAFSRNSMAATIAGTLSLAMLTGCPAPNAPTTSPTPAASATAAATAAPVTTGTATPGTTASATPVTGTPVPTVSGSPGATPVPTVTASAPTSSGAKVTVSGNVYDETGAPVDGATVKVTSTDKSAPYEATVVTAGGNYVLNSVPEGVVLEFSASKNGWTSRRRNKSFQQSDSSNKQVNFGSQGGDVGGDGNAYFISDYPEISKTEPATEATGIEHTKLSYKMTVSEPLDAENRARLLDSIRIFPGDDLTSPGVATGNKVIQGQDTVFGTTGAKLTDLVDPVLETDSTTKGDPTAASYVAIDYVVKNGSLFLDNTANRAKGSWNADGTELSFEFNVGMLAGKSTEGRYQVALVTGTDKKPIEAKNNGSIKQLGTDINGSLSKYPATAGLMIRNTFLEKTLATEDTDTTAGLSAVERWATTHDTVVSYSVKRDEVLPTLTAVAVSHEVSNSTRIELTFSEPMVAYDASPLGRAHVSIYDGTTLSTVPKTTIADLLSKYTFSLSANKDGTKNTTMDGIIGTNTNETINPITTASMGADADLDREFRFSAAALSLLTGQETKKIVDVATTGHIFIEVDSNNPATVFLWIKGRPNFFKSGASNNARELRALAYDVADPAGNTINRATAEKALPTATTL